MTAVDIDSIYAIITTASTVVFAYLWYRRNEVFKAAVAIADAYKDEEITKEEFDEICKKLSDIIYKK